MWMLLMLLSSELSLDAKKPVETFYATEDKCEEAYRAENEKGNYSGFCIPVTWKPVSLDEKESS